MRGVPLRADTATCLLGVAAVALAAWDLAPGGLAASWPAGALAALALVPAGYPGRPVRRAAGTFAACSALAVSAGAVGILAILAAATERCLTP